MQRSELVAIARQWLGTPWVHHQRSINLGVDCVQLIAAIAEDCGLIIPKLENYYRTPEGDSLLIKLREYLTQIPFEETKIGDVYLFKIAGVPTHVGIKTDIGLLHADTRAKKVVEHELGFWQNLIVACFSLPQIED